MNNFLIVCFFLLSGNSFSQYPGYELISDVTSFKKQFASSSKKIFSIKSDFIQVKNLSMLTDKITSRGKFWYQKRSKVRLEYTHPFSYLMIINNNNVLIKDNNKTTTVSVKSSKIFNQISRIMLDCVEGTAMENKDFDIKVFEDKETFLIEMTPVTKGLKEFFKNINIIVEKKNYTVDRLDMIEVSGDNTVMTFNNKETNIEISDAKFSIH
jgi:outer membrane lipoprotein-sorting protein